MGERYIPPEVLGAVGAEGGEKKKRLLWERITRAKEAAAFVTLLALLAPDIAEAKGRGKAPTREKPTAAEVERGPEAARVAQLAERLRSRGAEGTLEYSGHRIPIRRWTASDGHIVEAAYDAAGKPTWVFGESSDGERRYVDEDADGLVDRVVMNRSTLRLGGRPKSATHKSAENNLHMLQSMEDLARAAEMTSSLAPEDTLVFSIDRSGEGVSMRDVDFKSGGTARLEGAEAAELARKVQARFDRMVGEDLGAIGE